MWLTTRTLKSDLCRCFCSF